MVSAGIVFESCIDCSVTGGSISGFESAVIAKNSRGLSVDGMSMNTLTGIDAENCTDLNFRNNQHGGIKQDYSSFQQPNRHSNNTQISVTMLYALYYLRAFKYNPYL